MALRAMSVRVIMPLSYPSQTDHNIGTRFKKERKKKKRKREESTGPPHWTLSSGLLKKVIYRNPIR